MKLSKDAIEKEISSTEPTANDIAERSLNRRINDAAAECAASGYPDWKAPRLNITEARAAAHARITAENAAKQVQ
jgi:hypothetical protein